MLNNSEESPRPNRSLYFCGILLLSSLLTITYLPGLGSITEKKWQPSLVTSDVWIDELDVTLTNGTEVFLDTKEIEDFDELNTALRLISMSAEFGWHRLYYIEGNENEHVQKLIDRDLHIAGLLYVILAGSSLVLFLLSVSGMMCKNKYCISFFMVLSWMCLAVAVGIYVFNFHDSVIKDFLPETEAALENEIRSAINDNLDSIEEQIEDMTGVVLDLTFDLDITFGHYWMFSSGLIGNVVGLILLPAINIMLCV